MIVSKINFSKEYTQQAKGIALLLLIFHHLFYQNVGDYRRWYLFDTDVLTGFAGFAKVCVGFFVLLSGYGLYKSQQNREVGLKSFYLRHYLKLYETYWFIWLVFVPISVFVFGRTFSAVYPDNTLLYFLSNFWGMQYLLNDYGYNPTWWFMSCIIILYFLFPFIKVLIEYFDYFILLLILLLSFSNVKIKFMFLSNVQSKVLMLLGKHSFNIFLFHTFIYYYFFKDFIYSFYYPILIFAILTIICLGISIGIDYVKEKIKWEKPFSRMKNFEVKDDIYF